MSPLQLQSCPYTSGAMQEVLALIPSSDVLCEHSHAFISFRLDLSINRLFLALGKDMASATARAAALSEALTFSEGLAREADGVLEEYTTRLAALARMVAPLSDKTQVQQADAIMDTYCRIAMSPAVQRPIRYLMVLQPADLAGTHAGQADNQQGSAADQRGAAAP